MIGSKFVKVFVLSTCITVLSAGMAFADTGKGQAAVVQPAVGQAQQSTVAGGLLEKQKEIDTYVFEQHAKEITDKGFKVTHTAPMDGYVEVGITPYNEANADYLYKVFGKDMVKVVEGEQATTMGIASDSDKPAELAATSNDLGKATEATQTSSFMPIALTGALGAGALGGIIIVARRRKAASR